MGPDDSRFRPTWITPSRAPHIAARGRPVRKSRQVWSGTSFFLSEQTCYRWKKSYGRMLPPDIGNLNLDAPDPLHPHQRDGRDWSRRLFLTGTTMTLCGMATCGVEALSETQSDVAGQGHHDFPWYPLQPPPETSADLRELT
jgi:hypothetical protein